MQYRKAEKSDIDQLAEMRWDFQTEFEENKPVWEKEDFIKSCKNFYSKMFDSSNWLFWVVESDSKIIAHVSIFIVDNIPTPEKLINKWGYLTNTYTKKDFRGKGIGSKLIKHVIDDAKSLNIETIIVWPSDKSIEFYARARFNKTTEIMEFPID